VLSHRRAAWGRGLGWQAGTSSAAHGAQHRLGPLSPLGNGRLPTDTAYGAAGTHWNPAKPAKPHPQRRGPPRQPPSPQPDRFSPGGPEIWLVSVCAVSRRTLRCAALCDAEVPAWTPSVDASGARVVGEVAATAARVVPCARCYRAPPVRRRRGRVPGGRDACMRSASSTRS